MSDLIGSMIKRNLISECFDIFDYLDSEYFLNCRLVCKLWNAFIDNHFYNEITGKKYLKRKLNRNFFSKDYIPREIKVDVDVIITGYLNQYDEVGQLRSLSADEYGIILFTTNKDVICFEPLCLREVWRTKIDKSCYLLNDRWVFMNEMNKNYIFIFARLDGIRFAEEFDVHFWIIDRSNGEILSSKFDPTNPDSSDIPKLWCSFKMYQNLGVPAMKVYQNDLLCLFDCGVIAFFKLPSHDEMKSPSIQKLDTLYAEELYDCPITYNQTGHKKPYLPSFLFNDGNHLISLCDNPSREIIEWDFITGQKRNKMHLKKYIDSDHDIIELIVKWPYVLVRFQPYTCNDFTIVICNIDDGKVIKKNLLNSICFQNIVTNCYDNSSSVEIMTKKEELLGM